MTTISWSKCLCESILKLISITSSIGTIALRKGEIEGVNPITGLKIILI
jgi:hypothetical protein